MELQKKKKNLGALKCAYCLETNMSITFKKFQLCDDLVGQAAWH